MYSLIFLLYAASGGELDPKRLKRLGIDEIALVKGQKNYCAVLVNLDTGKLIAILEKRTQEELRETLTGWGKEVLEQIEEVSIDLWLPYIRCPSTGVVAGCTMDDWRLDATMDFMTPDSETGLYRPLQPAQEGVPDDAMGILGDIVAAIGNTSETTISSSNRFCGKGVGLPAFSAVVLFWGLSL